MSVHELLTIPFVKGALGGFGAAVVVDLRSVAAKGSWSDFKLSIAAVHWLLGAVTGAGFGQLL